MMSEEERAADTSKGGRSDGEDTTSERGDNKKRCCARCRNHESELVELKGHKNYCPWRDCYCELCLKTVFRQKLMADQTATRRKRVEMERRAKKGLPLIVPTANQAKRLKTAPHNIVPPPEPTPIVSYNPPPIGPTDTSLKTRVVIGSPTDYSQPSRSREVSWEAITELMNIFNFNVNTSCLLYLVLKYISNNVKDARSIILSAKEDIKKISNKTLNGGATPMVQPMFTMNQLEVVPLYVVPSEKVLDLSYPGLGYPRTPVSTQGYPYPRAGTPPPSSQCFGWKQSFRQPNWPNPAQPYDRVPITPYHENERGQNIEEYTSFSTRRSPSLYSPEEAAGVQRMETETNKRPSVPNIPLFKVDKSTVPSV